MNGSSAWILNQQPSARGVSEWVSEWMINVSRFNANHIKRTNSHFYLFICRNEASIFQVSKCFLRRAARNVIVLDQVLYDHTIPFLSLLPARTPHHITLYRLHRTCSGRAFALYSGFYAFSRSVRARMLLPHDGNATKYFLDSMMKRWQTNAHARTKFTKIDEEKLANHRFSTFFVLIIV